MNKSSHGDYYFQFALEIPFEYLIKNSRLFRDGCGDF
jgi:hypothetical protein